MDRFLVTAEAYGILTTVVLNKVDALDEEGRTQAEELAAVYRDAGYGWLEVRPTRGRDWTHRAERQQASACFPAIRA